MSLPEQKERENVNVLLITMMYRIGWSYHIILGFDLNKEMVRFSEWTHKNDRVSIKDIVVHSYITSVSNNHVFIVQNSLKKNFHS